jgi:hypothetical protein
MAQKSKKTTRLSKPAAKRRTLNSGGASKATQTRRDIYDRDMRRNIGQFVGRAQPHMSKKGSRGKN